MIYGDSGPALARLAAALRHRGVERALLVSEANEAGQAPPGCEWLRNDGLPACGARQQAGLRAALARGWDPILTLRPEHDPAAVPRLLDALAPGVDVALGSRLAWGGEGLSLGRRAGLRALGAALDWAAGAHLGEPTSGYRLARAAALRRVSLDELSPGRAFDVELVLALAERGAQIVEVGVAGESSLGPTAALGYALGALRVGGRALDARLRGVLGFPGPALPPAAPVVGPSTRPGRSLPVVQRDGENLSTAGGGSG
ncbi:MAG: hypothetical protein AB7N76_04285 [Planctomycetota bacterium]